MCGQTSMETLTDYFFMNKDNHGESIRVGEWFSNPFFERTPLKENLCSSLPSDKCAAYCHWARLRAYYPQNTFTHQALSPCR